MLHRAIRRVHGWLGHVFKPPKYFECDHAFARCWCGETLCVTRER